MKIALIGYGKIGQLIEKLAPQANHEIVAIIDPKLPSRTISKANLKDADVCIDFSHPNAVFDNIQKLAECGKNIVVGTTGWYDQIDHVQKIVSTNSIGFLYAPNFSIGVHLFLQIIKEAAQLINAFDQYDIGGFEAHHQQKVDSPSGTAKAIAQMLLDRIERKNSVIYGSPQKALESHELHFGSLRCGSLPGTHTITFDSPVDTITITHEAKNREGFARGALSGAEWLQGKQGFYTIEDLLGGLV